ncbi:hypothetical protein X747_32850 [Mesorhizobium sp. LNJC384A00]|nr:hypothetical protein X747_32850 [Mesorhizobium sp. LNJC384A00]
MDPDLRVGEAIGLGMKGTMSELELSLLRARSTEALKQTVMRQTRYRDHRQDYSASRHTYSCQHRPWRHCN